MRNSTSGSTPKTKNTVQDETNTSSTNVVSNNNAEKSSAKKLKQARLPFKVIAPGTSPVGTKAVTTTPLGHQEKDKEANKTGVQNSTESRKRKLSYDEVEEAESNVNSVSVSGGGGADDNDDEDNVSKENVEIVTAASKKKKLSSIESTAAEVVLLSDDEDDVSEEKGNHIEESHKELANTSKVSGAKKTDLVLKTPNASAKDIKRKGAGTPNNTTSSAQKDKNSGSASKLQIKLPLSAGKKKRRKSKLHQLSLNNSAAADGSHNNSAQELSSDDIEEIAVELNPQKRQKLSFEEDKEQEKKNEKSADEKKEIVETIALDSDSESEDNKSTGKKTLKEKLSDNKGSKKSIEQTNKTTLKVENENKVNKPENSSSPESDSKKEEKSSDKSENEDVENVDISKSSSEDDDDDTHNEDKEALDESVLTEQEHDNEADDETEEVNKTANISSDISESSTKSKLNNTLETQKNNSSTAASSKNLTPKQVKLMEQRRKAREEKERKLQEEKLKKQREREEKEEQRRKEREEKEEQKRKEREEKEEQKRKEREEKERKRLAEVEAKNEEKRKKNEAKEEELRKKEEERKRKEQEKEEAELKKKKAAQAFTKFFVPKTPTNANVKNEEDSNTGDDTKLLAFRPFQVKGDMKLAPVCRKNITAEQKARLDDLLGCKTNNDNEEDEGEDDIVRRKPLPKSQLYLAELRSGKILPGKWRRPSTESKDDVILVEDELDRVGQAIVEDTPAYIREEMRVKFYKFHDNRRPPYYGTWRKKSTVVKPRRPFAQDKQFFDYEVDSDDEWEEEEPGESLEDGSDDDKDKESEDDDYEVDNEWFVPHGHLSDEELQNEDEFGMGDDNTREAQKAKLQLLQQEFAQEMKKKTEKIKPRLIGCIWADINGNQPPECATIIWDNLEKKAMLFTEPPLIEEPEVDRSTEPGSPSATINGEKPTADKLKPISLSDSMIKDIVRLLHGNNHSKAFLINEYLAYVEKTEESVKCGDLRKPLKSVVRDKIEEIAEWLAVDVSHEQATDDATESSKKKKKGKKRLCWVVKKEILDKLDLSSIGLRNNWEYILQPKFVKADKETKADDTTNESLANTTAAATEGTTKQSKQPPPATSQITKYTKVLTAADKATQLQSITPAAKTTTSNNDKTSTETKSNTSNATAGSTPKEKKRVPLLMSVARGQQISTPAKNKLISQFLQKGKDNTNSTSPSSSATTRSKTVTSPQVEDDDVVILD